VIGTRSLPYASINSLEDFHVAFHVFCKDHFPNDLLYPECCHEFHLLTKDPDVNEEYDVTENTLRYQEIDDSHYDNHCDGLNIVLNASSKDDCDDDPIIHFENLKSEEQIDKITSDSFRSAEDVEGSSQFLDLQGLSNLQLELKEDFSSPYEYVIPNYDEKRSEIFPNLFYHPIVDPAIQETSFLLLESHLDVSIFDKYNEEERNFEICESSLSISTYQQNHDQECVDAIIDTSHDSLDPSYREDPNPKFESVAYVEGSPHFSDLQIKIDCNIYEEELKDLDQQSILYVSLTDLEQPAFNSEISKGSFQHLFNLQLDQQSKEVLLCEFDDPFADYLESMSSIDVKFFLSEEDCLYHLLKPLFCMIWFPLLFGSRSKMSVNHFLTWFHWKHDFT
jgi:hypothetical protein